MLPRSAREHGFRDSRKLLMQNVVKFGSKLVTLHNEQNPMLFDNFKGKIN